MPFGKGGNDFAVIDSLGRHEVGYHSDHHFILPDYDYEQEFVPEYVERQPWDRAMARLQSGIAMERAAEVIELLQLRNRIGVFRDRSDAGKVLAGMMESYRDVNAIVLAIPAGGVPVGAMIAEKLDLILDVAVTSKITLPWNPEAGYGAVAFDGTVKLNEGLISYLGLSHREVRQGIERTTQKVQQRLKSLRGDHPVPELSGRSAILVDDGLASGFTMRTAVEALHKAQAEQIVVAVPTAHQGSLGHLIREVDVIYCPNIRSGWSFAVADAYQYWSDMEEKEIERILRSGKKGTDSN